MIISSALLVVWYIQSKQVKAPTEKTFDQALILIKNKEVSDLTIRQDSLELITKGNEKLSAKLDGSDSTRDQIYAAAKETDTHINLEQPSSGIGWLLLIQAL